MFGPANAVGYHLNSPVDAVVPAQGKVLIGTGLAFGVPVGNCGRIAPIAELAVKKSLDVGSLVIDADYRDEVKVLLFNHSDVDY